MKGEGPMPAFPPLDWQEVARRRAGGLGDPLIYRASIESTSTLAATLSPTEAPVGAVIVADHQTAGRGRLGRRWLAAPNSGLACTVVLGPIAPLWIAPMFVGLALVETLEGYELPATLKWPNDALIAGRKCAGILIETRSVNGAAWLLAGIGINVHSSDPSLPQATHLAAHTARPLRREDLLTDLLTRLEDWQSRAVREPARVRDRWAARLDTIGREVIAQAPAGMLQGLALGVSDTGGLRLRLANGETTIVQAGDVTPAGSAAGAPARRGNEPGLARPTIRQTDNPEGF
jgi:BirA family biotin operon repressor/biotin-[acetyl-CoA-carboxylase] ligase